jgi:pyridoxamine 5'-phosphate oxidase
MSLTPAQPHPDPIALFQELHAQARAQPGVDPEATWAMALATASSDARPAVRFVLFKSFTAEGLVFYTNYGSRKAAELDANPAAAAAIHWPALAVQVRVEGAAARIAATESDAYWATRARDSQIGGILSRQSQPLARREDFLAAVAEMQARPDAKFPRPEHWGGYRIAPATIEFWFGQPNRLHVRHRYRRAGAGGWAVETLYP